MMPDERSTGLEYCRVKRRFDLARVTKKLPAWCNRTPSQVADNLNNNGTPTQQVADDLNNNRTPPQVAAGEDGGSVGDIENDDPDENTPLTATTGGNGGAKKGRGLDKQPPSRES